MTGYLPQIDVPPVDDPHDSWPVFMWQGQLCQLVQEWTDQLPRYTGWLDRILFGDDAVVSSVVSWRWDHEQCLYDMRRAVPL